MGFTEKSKVLDNQGVYLSLILEDIASRAEKLYKEIVTQNASVVLSDGTKSGFSQSNSRNH